MATAVDKSKVPWWVSNLIVPLVNLVLALLVSALFIFIAGENPDFRCEDPRVLYAGHLPWDALIGLFKRSQTFLHLSWLDHCPNVVVDARAAGCNIVCSSSGGTKEIAGPNAIIIEEDEWDFSPIKLYHPPKLDFSKKASNIYDIDISIENVSKKYLDIFKLYG